MAKNKLTPMDFQNRYRPHNACHKMVAEVAKTLAHEAYDALMQDNHFWSEWKALNPGKNPKALENTWTASRWGWFVPAARATLGRMLQEPLDEAIKESILLALQLDGTLLSNTPRTEAVATVGHVESGN